jgi:WD40 repeat protein
VLNDRTLLVTGDRDGTVRLWDACTQRCLATLAAFAHPVHAVTAVAIGAASTCSARSSAAA